MDLNLNTIPPSAIHAHTVVFLRGGGDTSHKFASSLCYSTDSRSRALPEIFPSFRWVFPQSELREAVALHGEEVSQWFDVWNVSNFSDHEELQAVGLRESVVSIRRVLENENIALGGRWDHIVLAGIRQDAATAVHTLLNLNLPQTVEVPRRLGAFIGFLYRMSFPDHSLEETRSVLSLDDQPNGNEVTRTTPVLLEHCVNDPLVLVRNGYGLRDTFRGFGAQVVWKEYPNGGLWFNTPAGIDDAAEFLNHEVLANR